MDINYKQLVFDTATLAGHDPQEALTEFVELVKSIQLNKERGAAQVQPLKRLSAMYGYYKKGDPYPPEDLLPIKELNREYRHHRELQKTANRYVYNHSVKANALLGGDYLPTNFRKKTTGTGASATTTNTSPEGGADNV